MIKIFFVTLLSILGTQLVFAQDEEDAIVRSLKYHDIEFIFSENNAFLDSVKLRKCERSIFMESCKEFKGKILPAIVDLWDKDSYLIKYDGNVPYNELYYFIQTIDDRLYNVFKEHVKGIMQEKYHFKTELVKDSANVLVLELVDKKKLAYNQTKRYKKGQGGSMHLNKDSTMLIFDAMPLNDLASRFKPNFKVKIYDLALSNNDDFSVGYSLDIPTWIFNCASLEKVNEFLLKKLGVVFNKRRQIEEYLFVHFDN